MDQGWKDALERSIKEKWELLASGKFSGVEEPSCSLCAYRDRDGEEECWECPVAKKTGEEECVGSPYMEWSDIFIGRYDVRHEDRPTWAEWANRPEVVAAAKKELAFLKSLREDEVAKKTSATPPHVWVVESAHGDEWIPIAVKLTRNVARELSRKVRFRSRVTKYTRLEE